VNDPPETPDPDYYVVFINRNIAGAIMRFTQISILTLFLVFSLALTACEDDHHHNDIDHFEAIGLVVYSSGMKVVSILRGQTTDTLRATVAVLSDHYQVRFYNEKEEIVDAPGHEQSFAWEIADASILEVVQDAGEEGKFEFHLRGKKAGRTEIEFFIMHDDHADFRSGKIPVVVE
jgi:hypothetical protein